MPSIQPTIISAKDVRSNLGDIINRAIYMGERFVVQQAGKPVVKIEAITGATKGGKAKKRLIKLHDELAGKFAPLTEEQFDSLVDEAVIQARKTASV